MFKDIKIGTNLYRFTDFSTDFRESVAFVQTAEAIGFNHVRFLDHVVGIVAERHGGIAQTPYTSKSVIRECFSLMTYLSAVTSKIELMTGVLVLPQRQTALIAKQAAEIDIYSGGRLKLGVGLGYNQVEYEAMGVDFKKRVSLFEEQVHVLRMLWCDEEVNFEGKYHKLTDVSLSPRPLQRPIPLFFGMGRSIAPIPPDPVLERCGRLADGWIPIFGPDEEGRKAVEKVHNAARDAGRDPSKIIMEMGVRATGQSDQEIIDAIKRCRDFGAQRINLEAVGKSAAEQIDFIKRMADVLQLG